MITFLRKIRKQLIAKGSFSSYLLYAIGEILLVVIGILIALQINNSNERRKTNIKIKTYLEALSNDLTNDNAIINNRLFEYEQRDNFNNNLRKRVASPNATIDTLIKVARYEFQPGYLEPIIYNTDGYDNLIQSGLIEELPEILKSKIKSFYNQKSSLLLHAELANQDYRKALGEYSHEFTFSNHIFADQGPLVDSLVWSDFDAKVLAGQFNKLSISLRVLLYDGMKELHYSLENSSILLEEIEKYLSK